MQTGQMAQLEYVCMYKMVAGMSVAYCVANVDSEGVAIFWQLKRKQQQFYSNFKLRRWTLN